MAILRKSQIRKMSPTEREKKLTELKTELLTLRGKSKTSATENPGRIRELRKTVARIMTIDKEDLDAK